MFLRRLRVLEWEPRRPLIRARSSTNLAMTTSKEHTPQPNSCKTRRPSHGNGKSALSTGNIPSIGVECTHGVVHRCDHQSGHGVWCLGIILVSCDRVLDIGG